MTEPLTPARFAALAEAYGGTILRWPEPVRDAAMRMARDPALRALLDDADRLDATLDRWVVAAPSRRLSDRIAARGPDARRRLRLWWSGIGIATALAGAAAGSAAVVVATPGARGGDEATAFGDLAEG